MTATPDSSTARPWTVHDAGTNGLSANGSGRRYGIADSEGAIIAVVLDGVPGVDAADAALIVAAVNERPALLAEVARLRDLLSEAAGLAPKACGHPFSCVCWGDAARAALAQRPAGKEGA